MDMASFASVNEPAPDHGPQPTPRDEAPPKPTYKSYKKKFLKLRHGFREKMRESNTLFDDEQRAEKLAQRLQEQNDQLLDLLLDVNDSVKIPNHLRYDLRDATPDISDVPALSPDRTPYEAQDTEQAHAALEEAQNELSLGQIDLKAYKSIEAPLLAILDRPRTLASLSLTSHSTLSGPRRVPPSLIPKDLTSEDGPPTNYLTSTHEEAFLSNLDAYLATKPHPSSPLPPKPRQPSERERDKDAQLHNPMSVFNWLSHHRPHVFLDTSTSHNTDEKPPKPTAAARKASSPKPPPAPARSTKRDRHSKVEEELLDEEGNLIGTVAPDTGEKKRKRGREDDAYRPKGGNSRATKRKRASTSGTATARRGEADEDGS